MYGRRRPASESAIAARVPTTSARYMWVWMTSGRTIERWAVRARTAAASSGSSVTVTSKPWRSSLRTALPPALRLAKPGWHAVVLVKPQFEAGRAEARKGVVRDPAVRARVAREIALAAQTWGAQVLGAVDSGVPGPKGNRELFLHLAHREEPQLDDRLDHWIGDAVGQAG